MPHLALLERRARPGMSSACVDALRRVTPATWSAHGGVAASAYLSETEPEAVLLLAEVDHHDPVRAATALATAAREAVAGLVVDDEATAAHCLFARVRSARDFTRPGPLMVARRVRVAPAEVAAYQAWFVSVMPTIEAVPGVVAGELLADAADPTASLERMEYATADARRTALGRLAGITAPVRLLEVRTFVGRAAFAWTLSRNGTS